MTAPLRLERVCHGYDRDPVVVDLDLEVQRDQFVAVVGPSGCGKTTLLALCTGWLEPTSGTVRRAGRVRMVFQQDGLFPWLTVAENVGLGLRDVADSASRTRRAAELLDFVGLTGAEGRYPHQLSGGMRQRAEIARALAGDTELLLLDEPFSSLDWLTRLKLRADLVWMLGGTADRPAPAVVLVTHDLEEAAQLADRVVVLSERPARVLDTLTLSSPRPRDPNHPEVVHAVRRMLGLLGSPDVPARRALPLIRSAGFRWGSSVAVGLLVLAVLRFAPWRAGSGDDRPTLQVGFLPVTCHLTCPVTDYASKTSAVTRFESERFTDFPTVVEALKSGELDATFLIAPLAMKLREQGVGVRIVYLGHRDGSTVVVRKDHPARSLADLKGATFAIPSRYSNQYLVLRKLLLDEGVEASELHFVEMPPPDMPGALASGAIDAYFVGEPHAARAELDGTGRVLYHAKDIWPRFISCVLVVTERLIAAHPEQVRDLVRGIAESGEWAETHREDAARLVSPYFRQDEALLRYVLTQPPDRVSYRGLTPTDEELQRIADLALEAGILERPLDVRGLVDREFVPETLKPAVIAMPAR